MWFFIYQMMFYVLVQKAICKNEYKMSVGTVTVEFNKLELTECFSPDLCKFKAELCYSYQLHSKDCPMNQTKLFKGTYDIETLKPMPRIEFDTKYLQKEFLVKVSFTIIRGTKTLMLLNYSKEVQAIYEDGSEMYDDTGEFQQLSYRIRSKCKPHYYPPRNCSIYCKPVKGQYSCDKNGMKICHEDYRYQKKDNTCKINFCKSGMLRCKNNGKCEHTDSFFGCRCTKYYTGYFCDTWDPCKIVKCKNNGLCVSSKSKDVLCLCSDNYYGTFCESGRSIEVKPQIIKTKKKVNSKITKFTKEITTQVTDQDTTKQETSTELRQINVNMAGLRAPGGTQFKNIYTVLITCGFVAVCICGLFIVTYWIFRLKYCGAEQTKSTNPSTNNSYPTLPQLPVCVNLNKPKTFNQNATLSSQLTPNWPQFANEDSTNSIFVSSTEVNIQPNPVNLEPNQNLDTTISLMESTTSLEQVVIDVNTIDVTDDVVINQNNQNDTVA